MRILLLATLSVVQCDNVPIFQKVYAYLEDGLIQIKENIFEDQPAVVSPDITVEDYAGYGTTEWQENPVCESRPLDLVILVDGSSSLRFVEVK